MTLKTLLLAAAALAVTTAAHAKDINIIVVSHGQASDPFWSVVKNGTQNAAKAEGVNVTYRAPETFDMVAMSQIIKRPWRSIRTALWSRFPTPTRSAARSRARSPPASR